MRHINEEMPKEAIRPTRILDSKDICSTEDFSILIFNVNI